MLNQEQEDAVLASLARDTIKSLLTLIQGSPGTGQTEVANRIVLSHIDNGAKRLYSLRPIPLWPKQLCNCFVL